jgi:uncharacterized coiled-coil protein SlyX
MRRLRLALLCFLAAPAAWAQGLSPAAEAMEDTPEAAAAAPAAEPARSVAKGPSQEARLAELKASIQELQAGLQAQQVALASLEERLKARDEEMQSQGQALQDLKAVSDKQVGDLSGLADSLDATLKRDSAAIKQMDDFEADFKDKRERLEGIADMLGALRKDLNDNSQEIVELKRSVKEAPPENTAGPGQSPSFWEQMNRWPYLSATALAVSIAALFVAIR